MVDIGWSVEGSWLIVSGTSRWFICLATATSCCRRGRCSCRCRGRQLHLVCSLLHLPLLLLLLLHPCLLLLHLLAAAEEEATYKLSWPTTHHVLCPTEYESRDALKYKVYRKTLQKLRKNNVSYSVNPLPIFGRWFFLAAILSSSIPVPITD